MRHLRSSLFLFIFVFIGHLQPTMYSPAPSTISYKMKWKIRDSALPKRSRVAGNTSKNCKVRCRSFPTFQSACWKERTSMLEKMIRERSLRGVLWMWSISSQLDRWSNMGPSLDVALEWTARAAIKFTFKFLLYVSQEPVNEVHRFCCDQNSSARRDSTPHLLLTGRQCPAPLDHRRCLI